MPIRGQFGIDAEANRHQQTNAVASPAQAWCSLWAHVFFMRDACAATGLSQRSSWLQLLTAWRTEALVLKESKRSRMR